MSTEEEKRPKHEENEKANKVVVSVGKGKIFFASPETEHSVTERSLWSTFSICSILMPDGTHALATGGGKRDNIKIWSVSEERKLARLERLRGAHRAAVATLASCGDVLVSGSLDHSIAVWKLSELASRRKNKKCYTKLESDKAQGLKCTYGIVDLCFVQKTKFASIDESARVKLWDLGQTTTPSTIRSNYCNIAQKIRYCKSKNLLLSLGLRCRRHVRTQEAIELFDLRSNQGVAKVIFPVGRISRRRCSGFEVVPNGSNPLIVVGIRRGEEIGCVVGFDIRKLRSSQSICSNNLMLWNTEIYGEDDSPVIGICDIHHYNKKNNNNVIICFGMEEENEEVGQVYAATVSGSGRPELVWGPVRIKSMGEFRCACIFEGFEKSTRDKKNWKMDTRNRVMFLVNLNEENVIVKIQMLKGKEWCVSRVLLVLC